jgi:uncharacterized membrane protein
VICTQALLWLTGFFLLGYMLGMRKGRQQAQAKFRPLAQKLWLAVDRQEGVLRRFPARRP